MLTLARGVLRANLVAVDALDRKAFVGLIGAELGCQCQLGRARARARAQAQGARRLTSTNALWTSSKGGAGMLVPGVCFGVAFGLAIGRG